LKNEMRLEAGFFRAAHHGTEEDGFEFAAVIGKVTVRLAEDRNDLRHLETEFSVLVGERGSMTLRLVLLPFGGVRPDLDALPGERSRIAGTADSAGHPEASFADPLHDRRALAIVVCPTSHRLGRRKALRAHGQEEADSAASQNRASGDEQVAAVEYEAGHCEFLPLRCSEMPECTAVANKCQLTEARHA